MICKFVTELKSKYGSASYTHVYTPRLEGNSWVARDVIISKEPLKLLSSSGTRGGKLISVNNFSAQEHASSENNYRVTVVRDIEL